MAPRVTGNVPPPALMRRLAKLAQRCDPNDTLDKRLPGLTESMQDAERPKCCPLCIQTLGFFFHEYLINGNIGVVEQMRMEYPAFFDAAIAIATTRRDAAALPEFRRALLDNVRQCPWGSGHRMLRLGNPHYGKEPEDELLSLHGARRVSRGRASIYGHARAPQQAV
ncbi:hypothetical protein AURDEDRAFT_168763 [Auricularia subglabra TFB-10046 SS5]|nr:hypothetical protein AURDEDRAFT_168763 [Auricularia subglabra TFB-10046 SS5]